MKPQVRNALILATLLVALIAAFVAFHVFRGTELRASTTRATLYAEALEGALQRVSHLPFVLATEALVQDATGGERLSELNARLAAVAARSDLEAAYLLDATGLTIAASNHDQQPTFLGANYGFRPYFTEAMDGQSSTFFAVGATTQRPGYFISEPVRTDAGITGVLAIKIDLSTLTQSWETGETPVFVTNADGIVILSSDPALRFHASRPVPDARLSVIRAERQFGDGPVPALDWTATRLGVRLGDSPFLHVTQPVAGTDWTLHYLSPTVPIWRRVGLTLLGVLAAALIGVVAYQRLQARRIRSALQMSQEDRKQLRSANRALEREIVVRRATERSLKEAETELRRSSKLAALGQLSASVTHELGQPIAALKSHLAAAEMTQGRQPLLDKIGGLVARIETITTDLRFFSRPAEQDFDAFDLRDIWPGTAELLAPDIAARPALRVNRILPGAPVPVIGSRHRLEQVLINLTKNAILATDNTAGQWTPRVDVAISGTGEITVTDSGPGLGGLDISSLQEPFHTTRASGTGMGLGLAIVADIVREHGGSLDAQDTGRGARFTVALPLATTDAHAAE
ncbi:MAG: cache domain-containing protein [Pseudomonadota bacterium]